jgi:hypothetical protein
LYRAAEHPFEEVGSTFRRPGFHLGIAGDMDDQRERPAQFEIDRPDDGKVRPAIRNKAESVRTVRLSLGDKSANPSCLS